jgi:hypothetical protein
MPLQLLLFISATSLIAMIARKINNISIIADISNIKSVNIPIAKKLAVKDRLRKLFL